MHAHTQGHTDIGVPANPFIPIDMLMFFLCSLSAAADVLLHDMLGVNALLHGVLLAREPLLITIEYHC